MKTLGKLLWNEPALAVSVLAAGAQLAIFLPDWRAGVGAAVSLLAGGATRKLVTPTRAA